jgi:polyphosphate kinase 2 (PPK2 family)
VRGINETRQRHAKPKTKPLTAEVSVPILEKLQTVLDKVDLSLSLPAEEYERRKVSLQLRLSRAHQRAAMAGLPMIVVFEGWDAAGKGGAIRRLTATLDARYYNVIPISKPTPEELGHHYLWRFWRHMPKPGVLTIFDRSWYGRVMVERLEGFCTTEEWQRAYQEINEFEMQLFNGGIPIVKFWLHISKDEQLARFKAREADPHKHWKLTDEDWRNREKWDETRIAVDDMVKKTSTTYAPWTIVEGNCKRHARVKVMETVCDVYERWLARLGKSANVKGRRHK